MTEQHKLLTIDGGGIRGVLSVEVLAELERQLAEAQGIPADEYKLGDYFDYVAGTSTGAVIAACIANGMSAREILDFYINTGPLMFDRRKLSQMASWAVNKTKYDATPLALELQKTFGAETTLGSPDLKCLFMAVTRNQTTDSPWPISSNPAAKYNNRELPDCNLNIPLWQIVRASTAAPLVYEAETIHWDPNDKSKSFVFVDGGITPYSNPAWLLYRMATEEGYNLGWPTGEDKLLLISVGTGTSQKGDDGILQSAKGLHRLAGAKQIPGALIQGVMVDQDTNCRQVGRCVHGDVLDSEIGDMIPRNGPRDPADPRKNVIPLSEDLGRKFLYARYNAMLEQKDLDEMGLGHIDAEDVQLLDSTEFVDELSQVGKAVAKGVNIEDFATFVPR